ncbi:winged helix-turn-helix transcriptional regulator [Streptomyces sp. MBT33]|nr:winged helix-turn-helix transcriptional regulator [Streptomyces sp. MBT33]MBK3642551.1 winged helix-turn-helix transcriptional regulator [Streptomyces sp. MBT33]
MRYSEVSRDIPRVSQKALTHTLRPLKRDGTVRRHHPSVSTVN